MGGNTSGCRCALCTGTRPPTPEPRLRNPADPAELLKRIEDLELKLSAETLAATVLEAQVEQLEQKLSSVEDTALEAFALACASPEPCACEDELDEDEDLVILFL